MSVFSPPLTSDTLVASPCVGICRMSADGSVCEGCTRTLAEISRWSMASHAERRAILADVEARKHALFAP